MKRRTFIKGVTSLTAVAASSQLKGVAWAQSFTPIADIFEKQVWRDPFIYERYRRLAYILIDLRRTYSGPNEYESNPDFAGEVYAAWRTAFGDNPKDGLKRTATRFENELPPDLKTKMEQRLASNLDPFVDWLDDIGIKTDSRLTHELLSAQALFATGAIFMTANRDIYELSSFTWVYPFC